MGLIRYAILGGATIGLVALVLLYSPKRTEQVLTPYGYPCAVAEISPDVPVDVKAQCRKLKETK